MNYKHYIQTHPELEQVTFHSPRHIFDETLKNAVLEDLKTHVNEATVIRDCTVRGKGGRIKTNKPKDGIMAFVWRIARFHNGTDTHMPVMAYYDLSNGLEKLTGLRFLFAILEKHEKDILDFLESYSDYLIKATGGNLYAAAQVWGRAMGRF